MIGSVIGSVIGSEPVLLHRDQQRAPHLYISSTAWAAFAVLIEPVSAEGLFHCFLDHPLPKALLHELLARSRGRQVLVSEVTQLIYRTRKKTERWFQPEESVEPSETVINHNVNSEQTLQLKSYF